MKAPRRAAGWAVLLRGLVMAAAAGLLAWPLTVAGGVAAAFAAGLAGTFAGEATGRSRLRTASLLVATLAAVFFGVGLARLIVASSAVARGLGPIATLQLSEALLWGFLVAPAVLALRALALRRGALAALEVLAVAAVLAASLAAHREGRVHRPFAIGDWAWSLGLDPALVFLALGALASFVLAALLVSERRKRRLPLHFAALVGIAFLLLLLVRLGGLPEPRAAADLGLTGDPASEEPEEGEARGGRGGGQSERSKSQLDDMEFKDEYSSTGSEAPLAVAVLHDDYSPPSGIYYFRQSAFSQYNGRRLVQATRGDVDRDVVRHFPARPLEVPGAPEVSDERRPLRTTVGLLVDHVYPFALDSPALLRPAANPNPMRFQRAFEAISHVQTLPYREMLEHRPGGSGWSDEVWAHYTEAPRDPRYRRLADEVVGRLKDEYRTDPLAQALAVKSYLDENGIYSRKSSHAGAGDPTASFLFGDLTGYCVHFAHAAAYLLRSRGVPTRVAAGYALAESQLAGGSAMMIRGQDAHAWPEVYLRDVGWVVVDLTPEQVLDATQTPPDPSLQRILGEMMRQTPGQEDWLEAQRRWPSLAQVLGVLGRLAAVVLAAAYAVKLYRRLVPRLAGEGQLYRLGYRAALDRLAEVGLRRRFGESREGFAERGRALAPSFTSLTGEHLGRALGSRRLSGSREIEALLERFAAELRRAVPAWRRWLGLLDPFSWLRAR